MKTKLAILGFLAIPFLLALPAQGAMISVDFDGSPYVVGQSVGGKTDPSSGTIWYASGSSNSVESWKGSNALKLDNSGTLNPSASLQNVVGVVGFDPPDHLVKVSFDYAFGGGTFAWDSSSVRIGGNAYNPSGAAWMDIRLSGYSFYLIRQKADGTANEAVELSAIAARYLSLVNSSGEFVHIAFELNTLTNTYQSLTFTGSKGSYDATSLVSSWKLPFGTGSADPTNTYLMYSTLSQGSTHYIDNIVIVPEPSTWAFAGLGIVLMGLSLGARRRVVARAEPAHIA